ncbi:MAG: TVP38/TMEM64 family protein [Candidatus Woesearchaeota archaeon]
MLKKHTQKFIVGIVLFFLILIVSIISYQYLTFESIIEYRDEIKVFSQENLLLSFFLFTFAVIIFNNVPIPFSIVSKVLGGFIFGFVGGVFVNIFACFISAMVGFYYSRYLFRDFYQQKFKHRLEIVEKEIREFGIYYFLSMRILMVFPYFLLNILGGISQISQRKFALSALLGSIPASTLFAYAGQQLATISSPQDIGTTQILIVIIFIAILPLIPVFMRHFNKKTYI